MTNLIDNLNTSYRIYPNCIFFNDIENDTTFSFRAPKNRKTGYTKDYVLVAKVPGPNDNNILMFCSTRDIGLISTVKYFTQPIFLENLEKEFHKKEQDIKYFEAIFEVQGFERTGFHPKLVVFNEISESYTLGSFGK